MRRFNYTGWRRIFLLVTLQSYSLVGVFGMIYFAGKSVRAGEVSTPPFGSWVRQRSTYVFMFPDENAHYLHYVSAPIGNSLLLIMIVMLAELVIEVRKDNAFVSEATRRFTQGTVPSLMYVNSSIVNICLQFAPVLFEIGETFNRIATVLSPLLWSIFTKHTLAGSLTILYFSPAYRKKILSRMTNSE
ncbi:hypothetical protein PMAYCL1PPCAC_21479, partial [Pristionchus mayeri]